MASSVYVKIKIVDITQEIIDRSMTTNVFNLKKTLDGVHTLLEFDQTNIPIDLILLGYSILSENDARTELASGWET